MAGFVKTLDIIGILLTNIGAVSLFRSTALEQRIFNFLRSFLKTKLLANDNPGAYQNLEAWLSKWFIATFVILILLVLTFAYNPFLFRFLVWVIIAFYVPFGILIMLALSDLLPELLATANYLFLRFITTPFVRMDRYIERNQLQLRIMFLGILISVLARILEA